MTEVTREFVMGLIKKKDALEAEIEGHRMILQSQNDVGLDKPLVDAEGFPRNDIDVYKVRHSRHNIICLQNDYKDLMKQIEEAMYALHSQERIKMGSDMDSRPMDSQSSPVSESELMKRVFAKIDLLSPGSPADEAGLKFGDLICEFGSINKRNFSSIQDIAVLVQHSVGHTVGLEVVRDKKLLHISLIPKTWSEKGLLGCRIVPYHE